MKTICSILFTILSVHLNAQEIFGTVLDEKKEPVEKVEICVYQQGILKGGALTDMDGNYAIKPLDPGSYNLLFSCPGYDSVLVNRVLVNQNDRIIQNASIARSSGHPKRFVKLYSKPIVRSSSREEIKQIPVSEVTDIVPICCDGGGGYGYQDRGGNINIGGGRTQYVIDGNPLMPVSDITDLKFSTILNMDNPTSYILTREEMEHMPTMQINDLLAIFPGVYQLQRGGGLSIFGSRLGNTSYVIDGMKVMR